MCVTRNVSTQEFKSLTLVLRLASNQLHSMSQMVGTLSSEVASLQLSSSASAMAITLTNEVAAVRAEISAAVNGLTQAPTTSPSTSPPSTSPSSPSVAPSLAATPSASPSACPTLTACTDCANCRAHLAHDANAPSGVCTVVPSTGAITVCCDMVGNGGGWTLVCVTSWLGNPAAFCGCLAT